MYKDKEVANVKNLGESFYSPGPVACFSDEDDVSGNQNDVRGGGLVVLSTFTSSSSFHYCLLDQGHILYNKKESSSSFTKMKNSNKYRNLVLLH
jgi:hypothetical protein